MNQKNSTKIRRRFQAGRSAINKIWLLRPSCNEEIISYVDASMALMSQEEQEMYLGQVKRPVPRAGPKSPQRRVFHRAGGRQRRAPSAADHPSNGCPGSGIPARRCTGIIDAMDMGETNYLILLAGDTTTCPVRARTTDVFRGVGHDCYKYFVCSVCPGEAPTLELKYSSGTAASTAPLPAISR